MPTAPPTRCIHPGCPDYATTRGRCPSHYVPWEQPSANTRALSGRDRAIIKREQLAREPNCRTCGQPGDHADHIIPIGDGGARRSPSNLQTLCTSCHDDKTLAENAARNRLRAVPDTMTTPT